FMVPFADQLRSKLTSLQSQLAEIDRNEALYNSLKLTLETYPHALFRNVLTRPAPKVIVPATVTRTNEVYTSIGDGFVVQQSAYNAAKMVERK
ncbi:uncharacterized protein V1516DRAFT_616540, partial [Lipomyces oligophaga]|uniref:uncharacterized protein n=1 Tax=Lipomyces oligophaga TaxID=45792 RepID=UPI0034CD578E